MIKDDLKQKLDAMPEDEKREVIDRIVCDVFTGRVMLSSSEILDCICETLRKHGLDDGGKWPPEDEEEQEEIPPGQEGW